MILEKLFHSEWSFNNLDSLISKQFRNLDRLKKDSTAIVTGGSGGLGLALVEELHKRSVQVIIIDINEPKSGILLEEGIFFYRCDISVKHNVTQIISKIEEEHGTINILINNAGIGAVNSLLETSDDHFKRIIDTNFLASLAMIQFFLPKMLMNREGHIVNIASILGVVTPERLSTYGASKGALINLHRSLNKLLYSTYQKSTDHSIRTILVCTGKIDTQMFAPIFTPSKILAPDISPSLLAEHIVSSMENSKVHTIRMPYYTNLIPLFNLLPWPYMKLLKKFSGMNKATAI